MKKITAFLTLLGALQFSFAQIIDIPDANFKNALISSNCVSTDGDIFGDIDADTNDDGEIDMSEALSITHLNVAAKGISSLEGIENFTNLQYLGCYNNFNISTLDVSALTQLDYLNCGGNDLSSLDVSNNPLLYRLTCDDNNLTSLDVSNNTLIEILFAHDNNLTTLNLGNNSNLDHLNINNNAFTSIDLSTTPNIENLNIEDNNFTSFDTTIIPQLRFFYASGNPFGSFTFPESDLIELVTMDDCNLTTLDLSGLSDLIYLYCSDNLLTTLDLSNNTSCSEVECNNNPNLESIIFKNGVVNDIYTEFENNPNLQYICVDDNELNDIATVVANYNYVDCVINTYCSFIPGGETYTVQGTVRFDVDNNGCDINDFTYPYVRLNYSSNFGSGSFFTDSSGNYSISVPSPDITIIPELSNFPLYTSQETSYGVNVIDTNTPFIQDICIIPNGVLNDLEISFVPLNQARPGFESDYKIVFANKGNILLSGNVVLNFADDYMDLVSANPVQSSYSNNTLSWNFTDLAPFETREINLSMILNQPGDLLFPLVGGEILPYIATINPVINDAMPQDNTSRINHLVVNSFDPNDKTCLEGEIIYEDSIGEFVTYLIRFENIGTANATNVVIKDDIDITKFDISSLRPIDASHDFVTRILNDTTVEFIFENIELPFDDANNDGYVVFKIRTLNTLQIGDTFDNDSEIYFDFNAPIITNNAVTTIVETLSVDELSSSKAQLLRNPVSTHLIIESNTIIESAVIYDIKGRKLDVFDDISSSSLSLDVNHLNSGLYFVVLNSNNKEEVLRFIKE